jgi:hypothetical protein
MGPEIMDVLLIALGVILWIETQYIIKAYLKRRLPAPGRHEHPMPD